jgi:hypothetical protein
MKARLATSLAVMPRRLRAAEMSAPSFLSALRTGSGMALAAFDIRMAKPY